jgi:phosphohistidine phosphatase
VTRAERTTENVVLLVRHAKAEDDHPLGDRARALTAEGRQEFREHARRIAGRVRLSRVLTSPLVRAVQTAELLAAALGIEEIVVNKDLGTDSDAERLAALAKKVGPGVALVGHNPTMAEALAKLIGRTDEPRFRKGGTVALTPGASAADPWRVIWAASPGRQFVSGLEP